MKLWLALLIGLCGCKEDGVFELQDGSTVACKEASTSDCGMVLYQCSDGASYICMTNVRRIK